MRKIGKELRKGIVPNGTKGYGSDMKHAKSMESLMHEKEVSQKASAKDLLQGVEVPDLRIFGVTNIVLDAVGQNSAISPHENAAAMLLYPD